MTTLAPPFFALSVRQRWLGVCAAAVLVVTAVPMAFLDRWLGDHGGTIVELELAGSAEARQIVGDWGDGRWRAGTAILIDYPFLVAYAVVLTVVLACGAAALRSKERHGIADSVAQLWWLPWAAAVFDATEDAVLLRVVARSFDPWADVARVLAIVKFTILGVTGIVLGALALMIAVVWARPLWERLRRS